MQDAYFLRVKEQKRKHVRIIKFGADSVGSAVLYCPVATLSQMNFRSDASKSMGMTDATTWIAARDTVSTWQFWWYPPRLPIRIAGQSSPPTSTAFASLVSAPLCWP